jgi:hypothetical protein
MRGLLLTVALSFTASAFAFTGAVYDARIQKIVKAQRIGLGMVYKNGKAVLKAPRACALIQSNISNEAIDRDVLVIGYAGKVILTNNYGINPFGHEFPKGTLYEAGVFYDPISSETETKIPAGFSFAFGDAQSNEIINVTAKKVELISRYKGSEIKSDCAY